MKSITPRERFLVTLLPSAILLLIYGFFVLQPLFEEKEELDRQLGLLQERMPSSAERARVQRELLELRGEMTQLRARTEGGPSSTDRSIFSPNEILQANAQLETLLQKYGVILMSESLSNPQDSRVFQRLLEKRPGSELSVLELAGSFAGVSELVSSLEQTGPALLPVAIQMDGSMQRETDLRLWNLWICR